MEYTKLGPSGIKVSRLCVGCLGFGARFEDTHQWTLGVEDTETAVRRALELGYNFFDTANTYAHGTSEEYLGRALKNCARREDVVIGTKVYFNEGHLSKAAIAREIDLSLKRLGTDYVDVYTIHRYDTDTPIEETLEALDALVKAGKVRALGASAMLAYRFQRLQNTAQRLGLTGFSAMQDHCSLLYREEEREMMPYCLEEGVALTPFSPLAAGRLSRPGWDAQTDRSMSDRTAARKYDRTREQDAEIVRRVDETAQKYGVSMTRISLAWLLSKGVTAPIVGASKPRYLEDAAGVFDVHLTKEDIAYLEEPYIPHALSGIGT